MKEKLWSPGKARKVWIIWFEDRDGAGDKHVYFHKVEAEGEIRDILQDLATRELEGFDEGEEGEADRPREMLLEILENLNSKIWDALSDWERFQGDFEPDVRLHVEEATLFGA